MYLLLVLQLVGSNPNWAHIGYFTSEKACTYAAEALSKPDDIPAKFICVPTSVKTNPKELQNEKV